MMYKKILLFGLLVSSTNVLPLSFLNKIFSTKEVESQPSETAKKLVKLAEYVYAENQARFLHLEAELRLEGWAFPNENDDDVDGLLRTKNGMGNALWDSLNNVEQALDDLQTVKKIEPQDIQEAQKNTSWLKDEPIARYIIGSLAHHPESHGKQLVQHVNHLLNPQ